MAHRRVRFEQVKHVTWNPGGDEHGPIGNALLVDLREIVQPGDHARVVVRDLKPDDLAVFKLALPDDVDEAVDVTAGEGGDGRAARQDGFS